jgi:hypothetical protein
MLRVNLDVESGPILNSSERARVWPSRRSPRWSTKSTLGSEYGCGGGGGESEKEGLLIIEISSFARRIPVAKFSVHADGYEIKDGGVGVKIPVTGFFHTPRDRVCRASLDLGNAQVIKGFTWPSPGGGGFCRAREGDERAKKGAVEVGGEKWTWDFGLYRWKGIICWDDWLDPRERERTHMSVDLPYK